MSTHNKNKDSKYIYQHWEHVNTFKQDITTKSFIQQTKLRLIQVSWKKNQQRSGPVFTLCNCFCQCCFTLFFSHSDSLYKYHIYLQLLSSHQHSPGKGGRKVGQKEEIKTILMSLRQNIITFNHVSPVIIAINSSSLTENICQ